MTIGQPASFEQHGIQVARLIRPTISCEHSGPNIFPDAFLIYGACYRTHHQRK